MARPVLSDLDFGSVSKILNLPNPTNSNDPATKAYVDTALEGLAWKDSVRVASTANINLAAPGTTIDAIALAANDRFLAKDQTTNTQNGIYIFNGSATPATRTYDAQAFNDLESAVVSVEEGTANAGSSFRQTQVNGTIGTTPVLWSSFGTTAPAASTATAGIVQLADQTSTDTGTDALKAVTPATLAAYVGRKLKYSANVGDGSATAYTLTHNFGTRDVAVAVYKNSGNYDDVLVDVTRPTTNSVTVTFATAPAANAYRATVLG